MELDLGSGWNKYLAPEFSKPYMQRVSQHLRDMKADKEAFYPDSKNIFRAFLLTPLEEVKVVILGQDPYHGEGQAQGLAFSVPERAKLPPSLRNIYKEIEAELDVKMPQCGDLSKWANQGVLLLNTTLTVRAKTPASHAGMGWELFTDRAIQAVVEECPSAIFLLWGSHAQNKIPLIKSPPHHILTAPHPSPFSAHKGFFGCNHFKKTNEILTAQGEKPIDWAQVC